MPLFVARTFGDSGTFDRSLSVIASVYSNITCSRHRRSHDGPAAVLGACADNAIVPATAAATITTPSLHMRGSPWPRSARRVIEDAAEPSRDCRVDRRSGVRGQQRHAVVRLEALQQV